MTKENILHMIVEKRIGISLALVQSMNEFKSEKEVYNIMNGFLVMEGHKPHTEMQFDIERVNGWCEEEGVEYVIDEMERVVYFRMRVQK